MIVKKFPFNPFPVNTYVVHDPQSKECAIIDPGCYWPEEREALEQYIASQGLTVKHIILTHLHLDHALAVPYFVEKYNVPFTASKKDEFLLSDARRSASQYGLTLEFDPIPVEVDLKDGDKIMLGDQTLEAIAVPGHSPGSIVLHSPADKFIIAGDVLFMGSIGRTDLPGGSHQQLIEGIATKLLPLDDNTLVYSGHGPETNIGYEKKYNPYLRY